jgi:hypothetical protein
VSSVIEDAKRNTSIEINMQENLMNSPGEYFHDGILATVLVIKHVMHKT